MPTFAATGPSVLKRVDSLTGRLGLVASAILAAAACFTRRGVHMPRLAAFLSPTSFFHLPPWLSISAARGTISPEPEESDNETRCRFA